MADRNDFADLLTRVCAGDEQAVEELIRRYQPMIRREVRLRLENAALRRMFDSSDVCQSVWASFYARARAGLSDIRQPAQLLRLLVGMARNKFAFQARKHLARRRDVRRRDPAAVEEIDPPCLAPSPSRVAAGQEQLREVRRRLSDEERLLLDRRLEGRPWGEIAAELGGTPDGRRVQLARALDRVDHELGLTAYA
jgi:RNA polymerase sigma factor (sigma-70 family)